MSLKAEFNDRYVAAKVNDTVLSVTYSTVPPGSGMSDYPNILLYDFTARIMVMRTKGHGDGGAVVMPFSQLDYESLIEMREKLVALQGKPPQLPPEKPATTAKANNLNL